MTHFLGKAPVVFKTKELSNVLEKQLKNLMTHFINKLYRQSLLIKFTLNTSSSDITCFIELGATWSIKYRSAASTIKDIFMKMV